MTLLGKGLPPPGGILSNAEQRQLIAAAQSGDQEAKTQLVVSNFKLVYSLVGRFQYSGFERDDLIQVGIIGLLKAIANFDLSLENCFSTYAVPLIIGEIKRTIRDNKPIHISRSYQELAAKAHKAKQDFLQQHDRDATIRELAAILEVPPTQLQIALEANQKPTSLQTPVENEKSSKTAELQDLLRSSDGEERWLDDLALRQVLARMDDRLRYILVARYFKEQTQEEIAGRLGVSQVQVSRLEKQALAQMRECLKIV